MSLIVVIYMNSIGYLLILIFLFAKCKLKNSYCLVFMLQIYLIEH